MPEIMCGIESLDRCQRLNQWLLSQTLMTSINIRASGRCLVSQRQGGLRTVVSGSLRTVRLLHRWTGQKWCYCVVDNGRTNGLTMEK
ncbi:hypothetical protein RRG08_013875 [Elysia crispata]|uniref:Uncharacterized protein n=1 Tax=Elysia crispata TaxID=231223 RepID=A0AAE0YKW9_9GAST|nr:hypothetical protein RRG08_013875 [Elysia crispata]